MSALHEEAPETALGALIWGWEEGRLLSRLSGSNTAGRGSEPSSGNSQKEKLQCKTSRPGIRERGNEKGLEDGNKRYKAIFGWLTVMEGPCSSSIMSGQGTLCQSILKHRSRKYFLLLCSQPAAFTGQSPTLQVMISDSSSDTHSNTTQSLSVRFRACNHPPGENLHPALPGQRGEPQLCLGTPSFPLTPSRTSSLLSLLWFSSLSWGSDLDPFYRVLKSSQVLGRG